MKVNVSVPIRGLFNLTHRFFKVNYNLDIKVSVPIRGLFNLTLRRLNDKAERLLSTSFRPHQGII